ncbi:hypothetical protein CEE37_03310 [candidate division LCP-89 bacterium B3_LCP]|uniref:Uncharacterized protein n=1 Tax=candidate division LCP-89 bacterium B3_LCP TaxID=2012998 RepID=A0A532V3N4_UNCL8|nr:MAG: hypothetical protein CEE37_03310 [candidate division LCP-89 bacterium B3_LCP]
MGKTMRSLLQILTFVLVVLIIASPAAAQDEGMYRIKSADNLYIYVHENNDLTMQITVLPDGNISYPLVGSLYVDGLTTVGLQDALTAKLKQYLQNPVVVVTISSQTSYKVYVLGEINKPGVYPYESNNRLTDYLALAGGTTPQANLKECYVYPKNNWDQGEIYNLKDLFEEEDFTINITLQPDDTILMKRKPDFFLDEWAEIAQLVGVIVGSVTLYFVATR